MILENNNVRYGIYNTRAKEFQFGISELSKKKAKDKLFSKIGKDAYKWRFEVRKLPEKKEGERVDKES